MKDEKTISIITSLNEEGYSILYIDETYYSVLNWNAYDIKSNNRHSIKGQVINKFFELGAVANANSVQLNKLFENFIEAQVTVTREYSADPNHHYILYAAN